MSPSAPASSTVEEIDQLLPQTQCTQCDFPRCREYAEAIATGAADINQCPPGGQITINGLAELTGHPAKPLNPKNGIEESRLVAWIDEQACIGCKLCIKACPVDCIIGAGKLMHTIIANDCTGCKLCIPVCPTDCIELHAADYPETGNPSAWSEFTIQQVSKARLDTENKLAREQRRAELTKQRKLDKRREVLKKEIEAAIARKRQSK